jgi:hypothetical protein
MLVNVNYYIPIIYGVSLEFIIIYPEPYAQVWRPYESVQGCVVSGAGETLAHEGPGMSWKILECRACNSQSTEVIISLNPEDLDI